MKQTFLSRASHFLLMLTVLALQPLVGYTEDLDLSDQGGGDQVLQGKVVLSHSEKLANKCKDPEFTHNPNDYILGPGDAFSLQVMGAPEMSHDKIRVYPNGKIILDIFNEPFQVEGLTFTGLYCELTAAYNKVMYDPRVTIDLLETKPFLVYITGSVVNPGSYEVLTQVLRAPQQSTPEIIINRISPLLSNVLVAAGGVLYTADLTNITIENKITGQKRTVNLMKLLKEGDTTQDVHLVQGDVVHVNRSNTLISEADYRVYASSSFSPKKIPVKVFGYVNNPGLVKLETGQSLNLLSAITEAGGYVHNAAYSPNKIYIYRPVDEEGHLVRLALNPKTQDATLFPNDIVYVPLNKPARAGLMFDYLNRMVLPGALGINAFRNSTGNYLFNF